MGLDTSFDCWNGAYSSFRKFREGLAKAIDMNLNEMKGFGGLKEFDESEPLNHLLSHSDCDGEIFYGDCFELAERIKEIIPLIEADWIKKKAQIFIDGLLLADKYQANVDFH